MQPSDLLQVARHLVLQSGKRPTQAGLRRAISTTYYALFHCLARSNADMLIGSRGAARSEQAWRQTYRALDHGSARSACERRTIMDSFPGAIQDFANAFCELQRLRHVADYDPEASFRKSPVANEIDKAARVIDGFEAMSRADRRAFAAHVPLRYRKD